MPTNLIDQVLSDSPNRRSLLKKIGIASAALGAAATVSDSKLDAQASAPSPVDILQFALNIEYLDAEFYSIAAYGQTLQQMGQPIDGTGTPGPTTTSFGKVNFGNNFVLTSSFAMNLAQDERAQVNTLRVALSDSGVTPVAKPALNLDALASMGASLQNEMTFLVATRIFEDVGISAYAGGAQYLTGAYALASAQILGAEAQHSGNVRLQIARLGIATTAVDGADIPPPPSGSNLFSTNLGYGLIPYRTFGQVLYLVYGNQANATSGGFFPNGVNGVLNTSTGPATSANSNPPAL